MTHNLRAAPIEPPERSSHLLNEHWDNSALLLFVAFNLGHIMEHVLQVVQIFLWGWPRSRALGALGLVWPWLVRSEWLHYWYALVILVGLIVLRPILAGRARSWWDLALGIQLWHHFEHALLLGQVLADKNLFGATVPTSVLQLFFPRVELHLAYNAAVLIPLGVAIYLHFHPPEGRRATERQSLKEGGVATMARSSPRPRPQ